jgi:hypothetical protein
MSIALREIHAGCTFPVKSLFQKENLVSFASPVPPAQSYYLPN